MHRDDKNAGLGLSIPGFGIEVILNVGISSAAQHVIKDSFRKMKVF